MRSRLFLLAAALGLFLSCFPASAHADSYLRYRGNNFDTFFGATTPSTLGFDTSQYITMTLIFANPLAANLSLASVAPTHWTMSDGHDTLSDNGPLACHGECRDHSDWLASDFSFSTDSLGNITGWTISAFQPFPQSDTTVHLISQSIGGAAVDQGSFQYDPFNAYPADARVGGSRTNKPGSWAVPEVPSLSFLLIGFAGIWLLRTGS